MAWEYRTEHIGLSEKWSPKRQVEELQRFNDELNTIGADGWEMVTYQSVPLMGSWNTTTVKGYAYLAIFKRPT